jgi:serine/threonine protein kinase
MASQIPSSTERDQRLNEVLAAYVDVIDAGQTVDRQEWLRLYPDLAAELAQFFANRDQLKPLAELSHTTTMDRTPAPGTTEPSQGGQDTAPDFGNYQILKEIARGGMGVVYRARHVGLKRVVALKMIAATSLDGASAMRRFRIEAEAAANLDHPNIVPIYEVGEHEGKHFFTMKLIEGGDLAQWIARCRLSMTKVSRRVQRDIARLLAIVARAVHHAHQRGVLHRDLKPANILLQREVAQSGSSDLQSAVPLVTDFGLAKRAGADGGVSQSLSIVGTAYYMAPEQAQPQGPTLTVAADVYSLGAVLYEMLTGQPPFRGETYLNTLMKVVQDPPVLPRTICSKIDADLERICLNCLAKAPQDRYTGADALASDLENWAAG